MPEIYRVSVLVRNEIEADDKLNEMDELSNCELVVDALETACEGYQARLEELKAEAEDEG